MLRIIHETAPAWIIAENVPGLLSLNGGLEFESVYASLENEGYEVQAFVIPACAVNAPHRRDRVWIVGYSEKHRNQKLSQPYCREDSTGAMRSILAHEPSGNAGEWWNSESGFCRVANGISSRVDRLRSLGNAIVPQVAAQIMRAIKSASPTGASS
jgi:DNA (cytosine-5)-methyltransferase 1